MCHDTKQKIAAALRQLMQEVPLQKITVQSLMDRTQMKRQSFYYHFQDIPDVLTWICQQQLTGPLDTSSLDLENWILEVFRLLDGDRIFYRRVISLNSRGFLRDFNRLLRQRLCPQLYPGKTWADLDTNQQFAVDFVARGLVSCMLDFVQGHQALDSNQVRGRIRCLSQIFHLKQVNITKAG